MGKELTLFTGTTGLNNIVDPVRLEYNEETGVTELSEAINVEIDSSGRISRSKGFTLLSSGDYHSMCPFDCGGHTLVVKSNYGLVSIDQFGNVADVYLSLGDSNARMDYEIASDGLITYVYYVNGHDTGKVYDRTRSAWTTNTYIGPDSTKYLEDPPVGHLLCLFNGRMYVAMNNAVYASEQHNFGKFNFEENYVILPGRIAFIDSVPDGLFISDAYSTYWLAGTDLMPSSSGEAFRIKKVSSKPIVQGTGVKTDAEALGLDISGQVILVWTDYGLCVAGPGGYFRNLTINNLKRRTPAEGNNYLPDSTYGSSIILNDEQIVTTFI